MYWLLSHLSSICGLHPIIVTLRITADNPSENIYVSASFIENYSSFDVTHCCLSWKFIFQSCRFFLTININAQITTPESLLYLYFVHKYLRNKFTREMINRMRAKPNRMLSKHVCLCGQQVWCTCVYVGLLYVSEIYHLDTLSSFCKVKHTWHSFFFMPVSGLIFFESSL